jgi:enolase-phosphatase E1
LITITARSVLLDIEGTTSSVRFVHEVMFPYARQHARHFLQEHAADPEVLQCCALLLKEHNPQTTKLPSTPEGLLGMMDDVITAVNGLMDEDRKSTGLKALQGMVWKRGFHDGVLQAQLYPDVLPALKQWKGAGLDIRIYSSGSIAAQKLFFGHTEVGDLLPFFTDHYDTTIGGKKEADSYRKIAERCEMAPSEIVFVSDLEAELDAAHQAGMQVIASCRPGNAPLTTNCPYHRVSSFSEIQIR